MNLWLDDQYQCPCCSAWFEERELVELTTHDGGLAWVCEECAVELLGAL